MKIASRDFAVVATVALVIAATTFRLSYEIDAQFTRARVDAERIMARGDSIIAFQQEEARFLAAQAASRDSLAEAARGEIIRRQRAIIARVDRLQRDGAWR